MTFGWGDFFSGLGNVAQAALPTIASIGGQYLASRNQASMMEDLADKQAQSYNRYQSMLQPSAAERESSYNAQAGNLRTNAELGSRRLNNSLAARGIRGRGTVSPNVNFQKDVMGAENNLYNDIYGIANRYPYGTPPAPPVDYAPSTGQLFGTNAGNWLNYISPQMGY